jgi:predicted nucleic acid-binding protein
MNLAYADTSIIVKSYLDEPDSAEADRVLCGLGAPLAYTPLHEVEVPNAVYLKRFRGEIDVDQEREVLEALRRDLRQGLLRRPDFLDLRKIFGRAAELAEKHSPQVGTRSLDLLHVAAALECGSADFVSCDQCRRKVAAAEGLRVMPRTLKRKV